MRSLVALILLTLPAFAAPVPKELRKRPTLEGTWERTVTDCLGQVTDCPGQRWEFGATSMKVHPEPDSKSPAFVQTCKGSYSLESDGRAGGFDFKDAATNRTSLGLYERDGASLKICFVIGGSRRPTDMKSGPSKVIYTFKRIEE